VKISNFGIAKKPLACCSLLAAAALSGLIYVGFAIIGVEAGIRNTVLESGKQSAYIEALIDRFDALSITAWRRTGDPSGSAGAAPRECDASGDEDMPTAPGAEFVNPEVSTRLQRLIASFNAICDAFKRHEMATRAATAASLSELQSTTAKEADEARDRLRQLLTATARSQADAFSRAERQARSSIAYILGCLAVGLFADLALMMLVLRRLLAQRVTDLIARLDVDDGVTQRAPSGPGFIDALFERIACAVERDRTGRQEAARREFALWEQTARDRAVQTTSEIETAPLTNQNGSDALDAALRALSEGDLTIRLGARHEFGSRYDHAVALLDKTLRAVASSIHAIQSRSFDGENGAAAVTHRAREQSELLAAPLSTLANLAKSHAGSQEALARGRAVARELEALAIRASREANHHAENLEAAGTLLRRMSEAKETLARGTTRTTLLALNAGVEAARAGELGRGMAIIAKELRSVVQNETETIGEIGALIVSTNANIDQMNNSLREARELNERSVSLARRLEPLGAELEKSMTLEDAQRAALREGIKASLGDSRRELEHAQSIALGRGSTDELLLKLGTLIDHFRLTDANDGDRDRSNRRSQFLPGTREVTLKSERASRR